MHHLTVYQRLATIIAVLSITLLAVSVMQILVLRDAVLEERRTTVHDLVDAATRILNFYDAEAKAGKIEPERARQMGWRKLASYRVQYGVLRGLVGLVRLLPVDAASGLGGWIGRTFLERRLMTGAGRRRLRWRSPPSR